MWRRLSFFGGNGVVLVATRSRLAVNRARSRNGGVGPLLAACGLRAEPKTTLPGWKTNYNFVKVEKSTVCQQPRS